jgi:flavin-dependent dehydrogenase
MGGTSGRWDCEVAVIGGGPGGSSVATALARRGRSVVVLEREQFPRFHIGESQLPWTNEILHALGARDTIAAGGFVEKWGASFRAADGSVEGYADFQNALETPTPQTFQVLRETFDEILLRHSEKCGARVLEGHRLLDTVFDRAGVTLRFADQLGAEGALRVGVVVDASGRAGVLVKRFGRHAPDPLLCNIAVHAQFEGIPRPAGRRAGDIRMFTRPDMGWLWFIPLSETVISVGAVIPQGVHRRESRPTPEESLAHYLADTPAAAPILQRAQRVSPARFDADYSYLATRMVGDRWVAVGDAAAFLDPIFSTGVMLAMQGGLEAAGAIDAGLRGGDVSARTFARYERVVRTRYQHFRRFAVGFYDPAFRELWFSRPSRPPFTSISDAVVSVLAGNWRPSVTTRALVEVFFAIVAVKRLLRRFRPARYDR